MSKKLSTTHHTTQATSAQSASSSSSNTANISSQVAVSNVSWAGPSSNVLITTTATTATQRSTAPITRSSHSNRSSHDRNTSTNEVPPSSVNITRSSSSSTATVTNNGSFSTNPSSVNSTNLNNSLQATTIGTIGETNANNSSSTSSNFNEDAARDSTLGVAAAPIQASGVSNEPSVVSNEGSFYQRIKKRTISGMLSSDADAELTCPICFDIIDVAHVTKCGHSFCQNCIQTALEHTHRCPKCNTPCSISKDVFPNFTLNQIIERFKEDSNSKKCKFSQSTTSTIIEYINSAQEELNVEDFNQLIDILAQRKEEKKYTSKKVNELLLHDFLKHLQQTKTEELNKIQHELLMINEDLLRNEECLANLKATPETVKSCSVLWDSNLENSLTLEKNNVNLETTVTITGSVSPSTDASTTRGDDKSLKQDSSGIPCSSNSIQSSPNKIQSVLSGKKRIIHRYFDELTQAYIQSHNKDLKEFNIKDCTKGTTQSIVLDQIRDTVAKITTYSGIRSIASVNYNSDMYSMSSIVSSVDFDKSFEHFAMAGVTKRIKVFDFANILERPYGVHYPSLEMTHNAKLSCVSWNRYFRQQLVCSDYEGVVTLWDAEAGSLIRSYQEHEKRCWGVQFCEIDPRLLASASDDSKVKIWSTNSEYSLLSIDAKSNVCCVQFKPDSKFHVLFGTADHSIHYYDLRNPKEPVSLFKGHKKAVSYVKFSGENEFVSASTDSNLKLWNLNGGQCIRSYTGHVNEKNFVGLESHNGYIVTGSENNTVFMYSNKLSKPLLTYKFDDGLANNKKEEGMNDFVSAVCWSNQNYLLAANSQGIVKVLEVF